MEKTILYISFVLIASSGFCQDNSNYINNAGIYTSLQMLQDESPVIIPQIWYYENDYYIEGRFNYEEINALSVYIGKTFGLSKNSDIELTPVTGLVIGNTISLSPGLNFSYNSDRLSVTSENQFTIDMNCLNDHFFWDWTKVNYFVTNFASIGCGSQFLWPKYDSSKFDFGPMLSLNYKDLSLELFSYNFWNDDIFWVLAFSYNYERK